jgi:hypothetical protein
MNERAVEKKASATPSQVTQSGSPLLRRQLTEEVSESVGSNSNISKELGEVQPKTIRRSLNWQNITVEAPSRSDGRSLPGGIQRQQEEPGVVLVPKAPDAIDLAAQEARGGHSITRHGAQVRLSELRQRVLGTHPTMPQSRTAMKFINDGLHKDAVNRAYLHYQSEIEAHFKAGGQYREWTFDCGSPTGVGLTNTGTRKNPVVQAVPAGATTRVTISFHPDSGGPGGFRLESAFPVYP